jgi:N-acetylmuramoyl-L-alanine amidase
VKFLILCTSTLLSAGLLTRLLATPLLVLDPGHGGGEPGVHAEGLSEAETVLSVALEVQQQLKAQGVDVALTRVDNSALALSQRAALANVSGARAFVSLHLNHSASPYAKGARIFIAKPGFSALSKDDPLRWNSAAASRAEEAKALALALAKTLTISQSQKVSVQSLNMGIFKGLSLPGVAVELGFLSHAETLKNFKEPDYRKMVASRLVAGIRAWSDSVGATAPQSLSPSAAAGGVR